MNFSKKPSKKQEEIDQASAEGIAAGVSAGAGDDTSLHAEIERLQEELEAMGARASRAHDRERRALADYQNLVRRTQSDAGRLAKFATSELLQQLIQPLEHLHLASQQLNDKGLVMVVAQLWQVLEQNGVSVINPLGEEFSVETMEAVDHNGEGSAVVQVVSRGYLLNGEVLQHAKVVVGDAQNSH
jgi:molecular chaperone GrpE